MNLPRMTLELGGRLRELNFWHIISENRAEVRSCREAAQHRRRLGHFGIPLSHELKTSFGEIELDTGRQLVMLHCRGDCALDPERVSEALGGLQFRRLEEAELAQEFGTQYGLVNPFLGLEDPSILQLFDQEIFLDVCPPQTHMTNACDLRFGIEFRVADLCELFPSSRVVALCVEQQAPSFRAECIGILTGNSPESGILLWQRINEALRVLLGESRFRGDISFPAVVVESLPGMGLSMELDKRFDAVKETVLFGVDRLCQRGGTIIGIACNTTQFFEEEVARICEGRGSHYVSMVDSVEKYLLAHQIVEFDLLGINFVADLGGLSAFSRLQGPFKVNVPPLEVLESIVEVAFEVKKKVVSGRGVTKLRDVIDRGTGTDVVLIALTELSILLNSQRKQRSGKLFVDTLAILAEAMANRFVQVSECL